MSTHYDEFLEAVNDELEACGQEPLTEADTSAVVHCFEYGHDAFKTMRNIAQGRVSTQQK